MQRSVALLGTGRSEHPSKIRRRRSTWLISLTMTIPSLLATGCTGGSGSAHSTASSSAVPTPDRSGSPTNGQSPEITDPLSEITDKDNPRYVESTLQPLLHRQGVGPSEFQLKAEVGIRSVRIYLACTPASSFNAGVGKSFSGECSSSFENFADIPVSPGELTLKITIPKTTRFAVVVIPTP